MGLAIDRLATSSDATCWTYRITDTGRERGIMSRRDEYEA